MENQLERNAEIFPVSIKSSKLQNANARATYLILNQLDLTIFSLLIKYLTTLAEANHQSNINLHQLIISPSATAPPTYLGNSKFTRRSLITDRANFPNQKLSKPAEIAAH